MGTASLTRWKKDADMKGKGKGKGDGSGGYGNYKGFDKGKGKGDFGGKGGYDWSAGGKGKGSGKGSTYGFEHYDAALKQSAWTLSLSKLQSNPPPGLVSNTGSNKNIGRFG